MLRLTRAQVREIDRRAIEEYHIPGIMLMENAARAVADRAAHMIAGILKPRVLIICGPGNNGGDGMAAARHLHNRGLDVHVLPAVDPARLRGDAETNWRIVQAMKLPIVEQADAPRHIAHSDLIIDALFGTGLTSPPRGSTLIDLMNEQIHPILAVDLPSGLDCDTGQPLGACVEATSTVTFVAEKAGFANLDSKPYTGKVIVGDIGCPRELVDEVANMAIE